MFRKSKDAPPHYFENMFDLLKRSRENASDPSMIDITYDDANNTFVIARQTNDRRAHVGCKIASLKKEQRVLIRGDGEESAIDGGCLLQMFKFVKFQTGDFLQGTIRENDGLSWDEDFPFTSALSKVLATRDVTWTLNQLCDKEKGFRFACLRSGQRKTRNSRCIQGAESLYSAPKNVP